MLSLVPRPFLAGACRVTLSWVQVVCSFAAVGLTIREAVQEQLGLFSFVAAATFPAIHRRCFHETLTRGLDKPRQPCDQLRLSIALLSATQPHHIHHTINNTRTSAKMGVSVFRLPRHRERLSPSLRHRHRNHGEDVDRQRNTWLMAVAVGIQTGRRTGRRAGRRQFRRTARRTTAAAAAAAGRRLCEYLTPSARSSEGG